MTFLRNSINNRCSAGALALLALLATPVRGNILDPSPAQSPVSDRPYSFVVWGHPYAGAGEPPLHYDEVLGLLKKLRPDFVIMTGDAVQGMYGRPPDENAIREDWNVLYEGLDKLGISVHAAPGNHDVHNFVTRDLFLERHQRPPYAFEHKGSRFMVLDTVGISQREEDAVYSWDPQMLPFDSAQLEFIESETSRSRSYDHLFVFMHHSEFWLDEESFWWQQVHPQLRDGKCRAVFSGNPVKSKFSRLERDGIQYIQSSFTKPRPVEHYHRNRSRWALAKALQFDTLLVVTVDGANYSIEPMIVGEQNSPVFQPQWFQAVDNPDRWTIRLASEFHERFPGLRDLATIATLYGVVCFLAGTILAIAVFRTRRSGKPDKKIRPHI